MSTAPSGCCAICAAIAGDLRQVLLDDRRFWICGPCQCEHPRSGRYSFNAGGPEERCGVGSALHANSRRGDGK